MPTKTYIVMLLLCVGTLFSKESHINEDTKKQDSSQSHETKKIRLFYFDIFYEPTPRNEKILQSFPLIYQREKFLNSLDDTAPQTFQDSLNPKSLLPIEEWRGNYVLGIYNFAPMYSPAFNQFETKAHISFRFPLIRDIMNLGGSLYFAFSTTFFFQVFNEQASSPVRDIDFEPELLYVLPLNVSLFGGRIQEFTTGWRHISNGQVGERSRGTDRWILKFIWTYKNYGVDIEWFIPTRYYPENPDIYDYMGFGDLKLFYRYKKHLVDLKIKGLFRINYSLMQYSSFEASYTYKFNPYFGIYIQYFIGYSDVIYEYNIFAHRIGIGMRTIF